MNDTISVFDTRCAEIKCYMDFIKSIEPERTCISFVSVEAPEEGHIVTDDNSSSNTVPISNETKKILKANVYLLLYNLVESTVRNTLQSIYNHLQAKCVGFHEVREELQLEVLKNLKRYVNKNDVTSFSRQVTDISKDIVYITFNANDRFNGNVDAKFVREKVERMGFNVVADVFARDGVDLLSIKSQRNSLAHGELSFCDCGKDLIASDLESMFERTRKYLEALIQCSENYLTQELYKRH